MSLTPTTRQLLTASLAIAVAGTAAVTTGVANAAAGATGKLDIPVIESGSARTLTLTGTGFKNLNGTLALSTTASDSGIVASTATCATPASANQLSAISVLSSTKAVVTLKSVSAAGKYKVCVKAGSSFVAAPLEVAKPYDFDTSDKVFPAKGTIAGGSLVTLSALDDSAKGGFRTNSVVSFDGVVSPKIAVSKDGLTLAAVVPPGTSGTADVTVTAPGFTTATASAAFEYVDTVTVSPSFASGTDSITLKGKGFLARNVDADGDGGVDAADKKLLVAVSADGGTTATDDCANVQVLSDTELSCTLTTPTAGRAYSVVVGTVAGGVSGAFDVWANATDKTAVTSLSTLTTTVL